MQRPENPPRVADHGRRRCGVPARAAHALTRAGVRALGLGLVLLVGSALPALAAPLPGGLEDLAVTDTRRQAIESLARQDVALRDAALVLAGRPDVLIQADQIRSGSTHAFRAILERRPESERANLWELVRYPELVNAMVEPGARDRIDALSADHPPEVRTAALEAARDSWDAILEIHALEARTRDSYLDLRAGLSDDVGEAFERVAAEPAVLSLLTDELNLAVSLGEAYERDPARVRAEFETLSLALEETDSAAHEDWASHNAEGLHDDEEVEEPYDTLDDESWAEASEDAYRDGYADGYSRGRTVGIHPYPYWYGRPTYYHDHGVHGLFSISLWYPRTYRAGCGYLLHRGHHHRHVSIAPHPFSWWLSSVYYPHYRSSHHYSGHRYVSHGHRHSAAVGHYRPAARVRHADRGHRGSHRVSHRGRERDRHVSHRGVRGDRDERRFERERRRGRRESHVLDGARHREDRIRGDRHRSGRDGVERRDRTRAERRDARPGASERRRDARRVERRRDQDTRERGVDRRADRKRDRERAEARSERRRDKAQAERRSAQRREKKKRAERRSAQLRDSMRIERRADEARDQRRTEQRRQKRREERRQAERVQSRTAKPERARPAARAARHAQRNVGQAVRSAVADRQRVAPRREKRQDRAVNPKPRRQAREARARGDAKPQRRQKIAKRDDHARARTQQVASRRNRSEDRRGVRSQGRQHRRQRQR